MDITGLGAVADLATTVINKLFPDKTESEKQQLALAMTVIQGQLSVNQAEAANQNVFVAGWRPFVGWVCGSGFAVQFVVGPLCEWFSAALGHPVKFPALDIGTMMPLLLGMLGLGGMRSYEKVQGASRAH